MIHNEDALLFLFKNPEHYRKSIEAHSEWSSNPTVENAVKLHECWYNLKAMYLLDKQKRADIAWSECLGVAVS